MTLDLVTLLAQFNDYIEKLLRRLARAKEGNLEIAVDFVVHVSMSQKVVEVGQIEFDVSSNLQLDRHVSDRTRGLLHAGLQSGIRSIAYRPYW